MGGGVTTAWLAEIIIITTRDIKAGASNTVAGLPLPADYLATFAVFGVLGALPASADTFAAVTGWGFVIATFLNLFNPTLTKTPSTSSNLTSASTGASTTASSSGPAPATIPSQANIA